MSNMSCDEYQILQFFLFACESFQDRFRFYISCHSLKRFTTNEVFTISLQYTHYILFLLNASIEHPAYVKLDQ